MVTASCIFVAFAIGFFVFGFGSLFFCQLPSLLLVSLTLTWRKRRREMLLVCIYWLELVQRCHSESEKVKIDNYIHVYTKKKVKHPLIY
jgi:hypothetical protein